MTKLLVTLRMTGLSDALRCSEKSSPLRQADTMLGQAAIPSAASVLLTELVLFLDDFNPVMGAPAVSSTNSASIRLMSFS